MLNPAPILVAVLATAAEPVVERDVRYRETPGVAAAMQSLDLFKPAAGDAAAGGARWPVMVYVHGGGWRMGDKARVGRKAAHFTERGWVFASVNYRLLPEGRHPANVDDVAAAIAWLYDHAAEHGLDPDAIFVMGHSAGAHLAALVATNPLPLERAGKPLSVIKGAIPVDTLAYDVPRMLAGNPQMPHAAVFGPDPEVRRDASPQLHVAAGAGIPPFLICYSHGMTRAGDTPRRAAAAEAFAAALRQAGIAADVVDGSDRDHAAINDRIGDPTDDRVTGRIEAFLDGIRPDRNRLPKKIR